MGIRISGPLRWLVPVAAFAGATWLVFSSVQSPGSPEVTAGTDADPRPGCWVETVELAAGEIVLADDDPVPASEGAALDVWASTARDIAARMLADAAVPDGETATVPPARYDEASYETYRARGDVRASLRRDGSGSSPTRGIWTAYDEGGALIAEVTTQQVATGRGVGWFVTQDRVRIPDALCLRTIEEQRAPRAGAAGTNR